jgi:DNA-binding response OmpR family regulator
MNKKILIVEDEEAILELLSTMFSYFDNYQILCSRDGEEALRIVREDTPDIILLDMQIPKINGNEVCRLIKSNPTTSNIKVLILTGMSQDFDLQSARDMGADAYMIKPFSLNDIVKRIEELMNHS